MTSPAVAPAASARSAPAHTVARRSIAAIASAGAVAAVGFGAAVLGAFVANSQNPAVLGQVVPLFGLGALFAWGLLSIANALGATRAWFLALITGLASAVLAALLATSATFFGAGTSFAGEVGAFILGSLVSLNLVFIVAVVIAEVLLAPRVVRGVLGYAPRRAPRRVALVRIPASNLDEGLLTHIERRPVDHGRADEQWDNYCAALVAEGWETVEVAVVFFGDLAVLALPGAEERRPEIEAVERAVRAVPGISVARILAPGTL